MGRLSHWCAAMRRLKARSSSVVGSGNVSSGRLHISWQTDPVSARNDSIQSNAERISLINCDQLALDFIFWLDCKPWCEKTWSLTTFHAILFRLWHEFNPSIQCDQFTILTRNSRKMIFPLCNTDTGDPALCGVWEILQISENYFQVILHGEHSVVFGKTALAASVDLRTSLSISPSQSDKVHNVQISMYSPVILSQWQWYDILLLGGAETTRLRLRLLMVTSWPSQLDGKAGKEREERGDWCHRAQVFLTRGSCHFARLPCFQLARSAQSPRPRSCGFPPSSHLSAASLPPNPRVHGDQRDPTWRRSVKHDRWVLAKPHNAKV